MTSLQYINNDNDDNINNRLHITSTGRFGRWGKWWESSGKLSEEVLQQGLHNGAHHLQHLENVSNGHLIHTSPSSHWFFFYCLLGSSITQDTTLRVLDERSAVCLRQVFPGWWFTRTRHSAALGELLRCGPDCQPARWVAHPDGFVSENKKAFFFFLEQGC